MRRNYFVTIGHFTCITAPSYAALSPGDRVILSACPGGFGRMADEKDRPPLARRVPGATQAGPAGPERRRPPELPEEFRQRIQAVVSAAHAQAARDLEAERQHGGQPDRSGRNMSSARMTRRGPAQADGPKSPNGLRQSVVPNLLHKREGRLSDQDAEFDTDPIPRLTASGAIADPAAAEADAPSATSVESNGGAGTVQTNGREPASRRERGTQPKHASLQTSTQDQRSHAQPGAQQEEEHGTQDERAAEERAREEQERAAQLKRERAAEERARQQHERQAKREQRRTTRQERAAERARAAEDKRTARQELARALEERSRQEQERAAQLVQERALQEKERAEKERIRREQELEDRQWAAQRRARQEREREETEARARLEARARVQDHEEAEAHARQEQERAAQLELDRAREEEDRAHLEQQRKEVERARQEWERKEAEKRAREEQESKEAEERARQEQERAAQLELDRARQEEDRARLEKERKEAEEHARLEKERKEAEEHARLEKERKETEEHARLEKQRKETEEHARQEREREQAQKRAAAAAKAEQPKSPEPVAGPATHPKPAGEPTAGPEQAEKPEQRRAAAAVLTPPAQVVQPEPGERIGLRRYRVPAAVAAAAVLLASGSWIVAQSLHTSTHKSLTPAQISAATRNQAAAWVARQVSTTAIISCDPMMCQALKAHGVPAPDLRALGPNASSVVGSQMVVATAATQKGLGSSLTSVYAPLVLATFGSRNTRIDIRLTAPHGAAALMSQFRADQHARQKASALLLKPGPTVLSRSARNQLAAGDVDSRLIILLYYLAPFRLNIVAFGDSGPRASPTVPLRSVTLTGKAKNLRSLLTYVRTHETAPYLPEFTQITYGHGRSDLLIEFSAPSPLGLIGSSP
jgi:hypothetical protein